MTSKGPRLRPDNNPGNARWCDQPGHMRMECNKGRTKGRGICHGPAIRGTDACKIHGGLKRDVARAKGEAKISAWSAVGKASRDLDAGTAVLGVLQMSWLRLAAYSDLLRRQVVDEGDAAQTIEGTRNGEPDASGLIGFRYGAAGKDGHIFAQAEDVRALVVLESQERDRVVKYAKVAHDMGISERLTNLAEQWGDIVATRISMMLADLALTPEQEARVPELIQAHLGSIDMESGGVTK